MGHSEGSPEREVHSNIDLLENRNISNKQPNPTPTRTWEQQQRQPRAKYKVGNNQGQSRIK